MQAIETPSRDAGSPDTSLRGDPASPGPSGEAGGAPRTAILDAVVRCFAAQGWAGTNMSLVARETGMTRGKIQYYFPVLDELKFAAIEYLYESWRSRYFDRLYPEASARMRFDRGVDLLWELARDPLHVAMTELEAAARTDEGLRRRLAELHIADEEQLDLATSASFPALAAVGRQELQLSRHFATIFINGLAAHGFPEDGALWQARLVTMLKECLAEFWVRRGVIDLDSQEHRASPASPAAEQPGALPDNAEAERRREALTLLRKAAELLSDGGDRPR
jgi:AcrR family transcriptional regulator